MGGLTSSRGLTISAVVVVFLAVNAWVFLFRGKGSPSPVTRDSRSSVDYKAENSPFAPNDLRSKYWREFKKVHALQEKASSEASLNADEIDELVQLSKHEFPLIQARAISGLTEIDSPANRPKVVDALCDSLEDPHWLAVVYAAEGLAVQDAKDRAPLLLPLLEHPQVDVRKKAKSSLDRLGYFAK